MRDQCACVKVCLYVMCLINDCSAEDRTGRCCSEEEEDIQDNRTRRETCHLTLDNTSLIHLVLLIVWTLFVVDDDDDENDLKLSHFPYS